MTNVRTGDLLIREDEFPRRNDADFIFYKCSAYDAPSGYRVLAHQDNLQVLKEGLSLVQADAYCQCFISENRESLRSPELWARLSVPKMTWTHEICTPFVESIATHLNTISTLIRSGMAADPEALEEFQQYTMFYSRLRGFGYSRSLRWKELEHFLPILDRARTVASDLATLRLLSGRTFEWAINYCRRLPLVIACRKPDGRLDAAEIARRLACGADEKVPEATDELLCAGLNSKSLRRTWADYKSGLLSSSSALITRIMVNELPPPYGKPIVRRGLLYLKDDK